MRTHLGMGFGSWNVAAMSGGGGGGGPISPTIFFSSAANDKNPNVTLSGEDLIAHSGFSGQYEGVRVTGVSVPTAFQFEMTVTDQGGYFVIGIENGTQDFGSNTQVPGIENSTGVCFQYHAGDWYVGKTSSGVIEGPIATPDPVNGSVFTLCADETAGTVKFFHNGVQIGSTVSGVTFANWKAFCSGKNEGPSINLTGPFAYPQSGYSAYDS